MTTPHRIALIGPGGSGKTTLAAALAERLGLPLIEETFRQARAILNVLPCSDHERAREEQSFGLKLQVDAEARYAPLSMGFVSDRSIYDYMIYSDLRGVTWPADGPQPLLAEAKRWWREVGGYTLVVYVPPWSDAPPKDDGERFVDPEFVERERRAFGALWRNTHHSTMGIVTATKSPGRLIEIEGLLAYHTGQRLTRIERHEAILAAVAAARVEATR